jgi:hypothetical protein
VTRRTAGAPQRATTAEPGTFRSVADIVDDDSLQKVRETKRSVKAAKKATG